MDVSINCPKCQARQLRRPSLPRFVQRSQCAQLLQVDDAQQPVSSSCPRCQMPNADDTCKH